MALLIGEPQTRKLVDMPRAISLLEKMFLDRAGGKVRGLPRRRLKGKEKQLNIMAAWHQGYDLFCLRAYVAQANTVTLYHGRTGQIQAIVNMGYLSSLRTGAATGVAAKYLAPASSKTLGVIGPGWQATFQVEAVARACPIQRFVVYGRTPKRRQEFVKQMSKIVHGQWHQASSVDEVEGESDILVVSTDATTPVTDGKNLKDQVLVASIGANSASKHEVSSTLIGQMDLIVADDVEAARVDSGDLMDASRSGILSWEDVAPLEKFVGGGSPEPRPDKILFQSNGIADEDLAVSRYVFEQAKRKAKPRRVSEI
jgi:ornithine cyclodeaminase/alanine dehydrogenase-like protein (mu-crystallin family)